MPPRLPSQQQLSRLASVPVFKTQPSAPAPANPLRATSNESNVTPYPSELQSMAEDATLARDLARQVCLFVVCLLCCLFVCCVECLLLLFQRERRRLLERQAQDAAAKTGQQLSPRTVHRLQHQPQQSVTSLFQLPIHTNNNNKTTTTTVVAWPQRQL
jgi:hypothetical protein